MFGRFANRKRGVVLTAWQNRLKILRLMRYKSFVRSDGHYWYRWFSGGSVGYSKEHEPWPWLRQYILRPGGCFVDAGAHVGHWAIRASSLYKKVVAFEPEPEANLVLRRNISRNHLNNISVFQLALSDHSGQALLYDYGFSSMHTIRPFYSPDTKVAGNRTVPVRRLDDFIVHLFRPMVLKIDVEGSELDVLKGSSLSLSKFRPGVVVEVHYKDQWHYKDELEPVLEELRKYGYTVRIFDTGVYRRLGCGRHLIADVEESPTMLSHRGDVVS